MENAISKDAKREQAIAWALEELRLGEEKRYPHLSVSMWHIRDTYEINYMNEACNCLNVQVTPTGNTFGFLGATYKTNRYDEGEEFKKVGNIRISADLQAVYDKWVKTFSRTQPQTEVEYDR